MRLLLEAGAEVDAKTKSGSTPLHFAAAGANHEIVDSLITYGADVHARNGDGEAPMDLAIATMRRTGTGSASMVVDLLASSEDRGHGSSLNTVNSKEDRKSPEEEAKLDEAWALEAARLRSLGTGAQFRDCRQCPLMVEIPSGWYLMGSPLWEEGRRDEEGPRRRVTIEKVFAVGVFEVTFDEWDACASAGGCRGYQPMDWGWGRGNRPWSV